MLRVLLCSVILALSCKDVHSKCSARKFPKGFQFGASTAAYQIEGAWNEDDKGLSIWDVATHKEPSPIYDKSTGDVAADSYHLYKRDVEMMKELGLDYYRFSVAWPRIMPEGFPNKINQAGIDYYNNLINEMLKKGVQPFLTMYHWDLPENLQKLGGWANPAIVDWFADYAKVLYENFGDRVKFWMTMNEPKQICFVGYGTDEKVPFLNISGIGEYLCAKNLLMAHAKAYHLYDEQYRKKQRGWIGISLSTPWYEPKSDSVEDQEAATDALQFDFGQYANPIFSKEGDFPKELKDRVAAKSREQGFPRSRLPILSPSEIKFIRGSADFFGLNSYFTRLAYRDRTVEGMFPVPSYRDDLGILVTKDEAWPQAESDWLQDVPWGFKKLLLKIKELYDNPPLYVTENGWSTAGGLEDDSRIRFLRSHLSAVLDAIDEGCNIKGYTYWSLMDNFEWLQGYSERFGLYEVDFTNPDRPRTPRKSAYVYKEIIKTKCLDLDFEAKKFYEDIEKNGNKLKL